MWTTCGICGKQFVVPWPQLYVYRRGRTYLCSEDCTIVFDTKRQRAANGYKNEKKGAEEDMAGKLTAEEKQKALELDKAGGDAIGYLKGLGIKNPYCSLKYIKEKEAAPKSTRKAPKKVMVETVAEVPEVQDVCLMPKRKKTEIPEGMIQLDLQGGVDYQLKVDEDRENEETLKRLNKAIKRIRILTPKEILRIVDQAALECQTDREYRWGTNDTLEQTMLRDVKANAENIGVMKLRKKIGELLKAETEGDE